MVTAHVSIYVVHDGVIGWEGGMEVTYQITVDGEPVRFGHNYSTASCSAAWKSYEVWAANPHAEVAIDEYHDGRYFHTLRNSGRERIEERCGDCGGTLPDGCICDPLNDVIPTCEACGCNDGTCQHAA